MYYRVRLLFDAALQSYEKQTGMKLIDRPFARQLENCPSIDSVMDILQQQSRALIEFCGDDGKVIKSLKPHRRQVISCSSLWLGQRCRTRPARRRCLRDSDSISTIIKENPMKFVKLLSDWSVLTKVMANGHDLTTNLESQGIY